MASDTRHHIPKEAVEAAVNGLAELCTRQMVSFDAGYFTQDNKTFEALIDVPADFTVERAKSLANEAATILSRRIPPSGSRSIGNWHVVIRSLGESVGTIRGGWLDEGLRSVAAKPSLAKEQVSKPSSEGETEYKAILKNSVLKTAPVKAALKEARAVCKNFGANKLEPGFVEDDRMLIGVDVPSDWAIGRCFQLKENVENVMKKHICEPRMRGYCMWSVYLHARDWFFQ